MNKFYTTKRDNKILLKAFYEGNSKNIKIDQLNYKAGKITEFLDKKEAYICIDKKSQNYDGLVNLIDTKITTNNREYQIDIESFIYKDLEIADVMKAFYSRVIFYQAVLFNKKKEVAKKTDFSFLFKDDSHKELADKFELIANNRNRIRNLQVMPENYCTSEDLAKYIVEDFKTEKNLKVTVLNKKEIEKLHMGLIISVNKGSTYEPRVVVIEYNGDPSSKEKIVYVGKGITFDTGGVNTKGYHMEGMKYDMSGSVIVAYTVKTLAQLKVKKNVAAIMCITDNRLDGDASLPENVYESMSGLSVEVTDTDAEGRLVLADGLYYGATKLHATTLVDVATLTGTILRALGTSYSGIYATEDNDWKVFEKSAKEAHEKVWRMPLHKDFHEPNEASIVADLNNYNNDEISDCNTAAMFLKQFTNDVPYIHCDVAGTADLKGKPQGVLIDTLIEFAINK